MLWCIVFYNNNNNNNNNNKEICSYGLNAYTDYRNALYLSKFRSWKSPGSDQIQINVFKLSQIFTGILENIVMQ